MRTSSIIRPASGARFARLPDSPADDDPLLRASVDVRIEKMLDAAAFRLTSAGSRGAAAQPAPAPTAATEPRSIQAAE